MSKFQYRTLLLCGMALLPFLAQGGQIYGSLTSAGKAAAGAAITVSCAGAESKTATGPDGTYRVTIPQQGRCTVSLPGFAGTPSVVVFSLDKPALYDLEASKRPDGNYDLKIR